MREQIELTGARGLLGGTGFPRSTPTIAGGQLGSMRFRGIYLAINPMLTYAEILARIYQNFPPGEYQYFPGFNWEKNEQHRDRSSAAKAIPETAWTRPTDHAT